MRRSTSLRYFIVLFLLFSLQKVLAQPARPEIALFVDAREAPRRILHVRETFPVHEGPLTLYYPKWIPGEHGPTGPVVDLVGLRIRADAQSVTWRRDPEDMYALQCDVPSQTNILEVTFDFVLPAASEGFSSGTSSTAQLLVLSWNQVVLYPKHLPPDSITVTPRLMLPLDWQYGTALAFEGEGNGETRFKPVSLTTLVDSPVLTGRFFKRLELGVVGGAPHFLDMASDGEEALRMPEWMLSAYKKLVREAYELFGARHYNHYTFLLTLSDNTAHFGLEHHQSSDNRIAERSLLDHDLRVTAIGLLPHEMVHSWNGKYRRPAGLATGDFSTPMHGEMLWVYEGLTEYLGHVLTARSGLRTPDQYREHLALVAAALDTRPGRSWRPLQDATDAAQILYGARSDWETYRRDVDFYDEGNLVWLEVDAIIRQESKGKKSLDDFCKLFHGGKNSGPLVLPFTFDDIVSALNQTTKYDWKTYLMEKLQSLETHAPLGGIERSGWKLVYRDSVSSMMKSYEERDKKYDLRFSVGMMLNSDGIAIDVIPGMPASNAGLAPGMKLLAVNGRKFNKHVLRDAIRTAQKTGSSIALLAQNVDYITTYDVKYGGGERYPFLERDSSKPDMLSRIISSMSSEK